MFLSVFLVLYYFHRVSPTGGLSVMVKSISLMALLLILLILTNDLHEQVFVLKPGFVGWDGDYTYGWLFYVVNAWQFALSLAAIIILVVKCRVGAAKKNAWVILIPFAFGMVLYALLHTGIMPKINGAHVIEFPEASVWHKRRN